MRLGAGLLTLLVALTLHPAWACAAGLVLALALLLPTLREDRL